MWLADAILWNEVLKFNEVVDVFRTRDEGLFQELVLNIRQKEKKRNFMYKMDIVMESFQQAFTHTESIVM